ncbi:MAG: hypothetical protein GXY91_00635 [Clostridia bacterium]|nr:hypothetical protein [Clostridia bacterium]
MTDKVSAGQWFGGFFGNYWFVTLLQVIIILFLLCWLFGGTGCGAF